MSKRDLTYDEISSIFYLDGETVFWKYRPREFFNADGTYSAFCRHKVGKEPSPSIDSKGYPMISFKFDGEKYRWGIYRIKYCLYHKVDLIKEDLVDHIDMDPSNNNISNLRVVNRAQNIVNTPQVVDGRIKGILRTKNGWFTGPKSKRHKTFCSAVKERQKYLKSVWE